MAELADALDLGSSGKPWGFESLLSHHISKGKAVDLCRVELPFFVFRKSSALGFALPIEILIPYALILLVYHKAKQLYWGFTYAKN